MPKSGNEQSNPWDEFQSEISTEHDQTSRSIREISMLVDQSQAEMARITQKNAAITAQLQKTQTSLESLPRQEIRSMYDSALDTQQRLLVMRGQIEKLQADQIALKKYLTFLDKTKKILNLANRM